jgi:hypothetical protein
MRIVLVSPDLLISSRIAAIVESGRGSLLRIDNPAPFGVMDEVDLVLVDWAHRGPDWGKQLNAWRAAAMLPRMIVFGPHTDLDAHEAARSAGLGPMWARSRLIRVLPEILANAARS